MSARDAFTTNAAVALERSERRLTAKRADGDESVPVRCGRRPRCRSVATVAIPPSRQLRVDASVRSPTSFSARSSDTEATATVRDGSSAGRAPAPTWSRLELGPSTGTGRIETSR